MGVIHVVQLKFNPEVDSKKIDEILSSLKALKDSCVRPGTQKKYITSLRAAADCSIEGFQNGFTHMVVTEFDSIADRDYYATKDPIHLALGAGLPPFVAGLQVLDIEG
ncbi:hypothetical protein BJ875DRAFT_388593 [Amylocarpus encephaloides]|uniref:Stress-response A/B barrel domain-containing protein n=1 Tax=Amylocarpus encephaloides TaxID=45428 RepID=A0A9P8C168_9HELO|nr:hypothetical protein BJ875DRAFT_388593 [Amylocarpus encephaloides]